MLDFDLYDYYKTSKDKKIILSFKGIISQQLLIDIGEIIRARSETQKWTKKIFSVFVEMSQNIMHYSKERELDAVSGNEYGVGIILFHETDKKFIVTSGNLTTRADGEKVVEKIAELNSLDKLEKKKLYTESIRGPRPENSKGAGLGLIEIARKTTNDIESYFSPVDGDDVFLILSSSFDKEALYEI